MYKIYLSNEADKFYAKATNPEKKKIDKVITRISQDPFHFSKKLRGEFAGLYAVRAWPYRITYTIDAKGKRVFVAAIAHRQQIYKR